MARAIEDYGRSRASYSTPKPIANSKPSTSNTSKNSKANTQTVNNTHKSQDNTAVVYKQSKQSIPQQQYKSTYTAKATYTGQTASKSQTQYQKVAASNKEAAKSSGNFLSKLGNALKESVNEKIETTKKTAKVAVNFYKGEVDAVKSTVGGVVNIAKHPVQTVKNIGNAVTHPKETYNAIKDSAVQGWNDFKKGDANVKARMAGRVVGEVALSVAGTKGVDKAVKVIKGTDAAADLSRLQKLADKATDIVNSKGMGAYSRKQLNAMQASPKLEAPFRGTAIDKEFKNLVKNDPKVGKKYEITTQGKAGPDLIHKKTGEWVDITTQKQAQKHVDKYTPKYGKGHIVTHK